MSEDEWESEEADSQDEWIPQAAQPAEVPEAEDNEEESQAEEEVMAYVSLPACALLVGYNTCIWIRILMSKSKTPKYSACIAAIHR